MCIRVQYYLVCTNCNNQFIDPKWGGSFCSPEEAKGVAKQRGWHLDVPVLNGSEWDFCPRCFKDHEEEQEE